MAVSYTHLQEASEQKDTQETENDGQQGENGAAENNGSQENGEVGNSQQEQTGETETEQTGENVPDNDLRELELADFQKLQNKLYAVGKEANKSIAVSYTHLLEGAVGYGIK